MHSDGLRGTGLVTAGGCVAALRGENESFNSMCVLFINRFGDYGGGCLRGDVCPSL